MTRHYQANVPHAHPPHRQRRKTPKVAAGDEASNSSNQPASGVKCYSTRQNSKKRSSVATDDVVVLAGIEATTPRKCKRGKQDEQAVSNNIEAAEGTRRAEGDSDDDDAFAGEDFSDVGENGDDEVDDEKEENHQRLIAPEVLEALESLEGSATRPANADSPGWGIKAFFDLLEHLVYSGNGFSQGDFEEDDLNWRQKHEQHITLDTILKDLRRPSLSTQQCYRVYLKLWAEFCDHRYKDGKRTLGISGLDESDEHGDEKDPGDKHPYEVTHKKCLRFFKDFLFKKPTIKKLYLHKDYSYPFATYRNISEKDPKVTVVRGTSKKRSSRVVVDLKRIVDELPEYQDGQDRYKKLQVCLGMRVMYQARSALSFLLKRQTMRLNDVDRNPTAPLHHNSFIGQAIESYGKQLVYGAIPTAKDNPVHLGYTAAEHVRMLLQTFMSETPTLSPQKLKIQIREHAKISMRHMCLLRDQDLRGMTQSDSYLARVPLGPNSHMAAQPLWMMMLRFRSSKTNKMQYAAAVRHEDVRRCAVGSYAFYLLYLFKDFDKDVGDFFRSPGWANYKVFPTDTSMFEHEQSYANARDSFAKVKLRENVRCTNVTHAGRHSGSVEAQEIGISVEDIRQGDPWASGEALINTYLSSTPYVLARGMAGFLHKPFYLTRNDVDLNVADHGDLMRMIFPFIEDALFARETEPEEHKLWIEAINREMNDVDSGVEALDRLMAPTSSSKSAVRGGASVMAYRLAQPFLLMLARFRRVILQDAVEYLYLMEQNRNTTWTTWHIPIFTHLPNIFKHPDFLAFKNKLSVRLREADSRRSEAVPEAPANLAPAAAKYIQDILDHQRQQYTISICKQEVEMMELKAEVVALRTELANTTSSFKLMTEAVIQLFNSGSQSSSQHSLIGYPR